MDGFSILCLPFVRLARSRSVRRLLVQRLPVPDTTLQELRPLRYHGNRVRLLRQESPERRMMPAELLPRTVPMLPDSLPQLLDFVEELLPRHPFEILVHRASPCSNVYGFGGARRALILFSSSSYGGRP